MNNRKIAIGILAHVDAGKTTLSEAILYLEGEIRKPGRLALAQCGYDICHNADEVVAERGYDAERDVENTADSVFVNHGGSDIVSWDEVPEHMHIRSVLRSRPNRAHPLFREFVRESGKNGSRQPTVAEF